MTDFERELRARLHAAAQDAPEFSHALLEPPPTPIPAPTANPAPVRPRHARALAVAAVAVVAVGAGTWWAVNAAGREVSPPAAACAAEIAVQGRTYAPNGDLTRTPTPGARLSRARLDQRACEGDSPGRPSRAVTAYRIPGTPASQAVLIDGAVWLDTELTTLPRTLRPLFAPVRCTAPGRLALTGYLSASNARVVEDYQPRAPYVATFVVDSGAGLDFDTYSELTLRARVTPQTVNGEDPALIRAALGNGDRVRLDAVCDAGRFVALSLEPA